MKESQVRLKLQDYFQKRPGKEFSIADLIDHFPQTNEHTLRYNLNVMKQSGFVVSSSYGKYVLNQNAKTIEQKRAEVNTHIATTMPRVVDAGAAEGPYKEGATPGESTPHIAWYARQHGFSILSRMKAAPTMFTTEDVSFIERLVKERHKLSEQQELVLSREGLK